MSLSNLIPQIVKDAVLGTTKESTRRVTSVGTWRSGKTTALACFGLACETLSAKPNSKFKYWPDEDPRPGRGSGIRQFWSDLRRGRFPPATKPGNYYETGFTLDFDGGLGGTKTVKVPFCETAGEDIQELIGTFALDPYSYVPISKAKTKELFEFILRSDGFILIAPLSEALLYGDKGKEEGPSDLPPDPDLNLARILDAIYRYRIRAGAQKILAIAFLLTKYDKIIDDVKGRGMDLRTEQGRKQFMSMYFPQTSANLKKFAVPVEYFPVFVQGETDDQGKPILWPKEAVRQPDGSTEMLSPGQKIIVDHRRRLPVYSEEQYLRLIDWVKETFTH